MSYSNSLSPLAVNALGSLYQGYGLTINPIATSYMGASTALDNYTKGSLVSNTILNELVDSINLAYTLLGTDVNDVSQANYDALVSLGATTIPALGCSTPSTYTQSYTGQITRYGWIRTISYQAYQEFYLNTGSYADFVQTFSTAYSFIQQTNKTINSAVNSQSFLSGVYSNMNDLITSDITGVNIATTFWGQDLINAGRSIDLSKISTFGLPSNLLFTMQKNNAITQAVSLALLSAGFTTSELGEILGKLKTVSMSQEKQIYAAFTIIVGADLADVCIPLNVQTLDLSSLADLLNPKMLFPNSYTSLTVPKYNVESLPTNSKTYYPIYNGTSVNSTLSGYGSYLDGIVPKEIAIAAGALSIAMQQIKNIQNSSIEKFAQVVTNLETTASLTVNGNSTPTNSSASTAILAALAKGSGDNGTYLMTDFFGAMSGLKYNFARLESLINAVQTSTLGSIYSNIKALLSGAPPYNTQLEVYLVQANAEILAIFNSGNSQVAELNSVYNSIGAQLNNEQLARTLVFPDITLLVSTNADITAFVDLVKSTFASDTSLYQSAPVLESICDTESTNGMLGGESIIGLMREARNNSRLGLAGLSIESDISSEPATVGPTCTYAETLGLTKVSGTTSVPGSFGGSPDSGIIPPNLDIFNISCAVIPSIITPDAALEDVISCNCDCWDNL